MTARRQPTFIEFAASIGLPLTAAQRVLAAVAFDRVQPSTLEGDERDLARRLFGELVEPVPAIAFSTVALVLGRASGKTSLAGTYLVWRALVADLNRLAPSELGFAVCIAPDIATARQTLDFARSAFERSSRLSSLIESDTTDALLVRRPDGRRVSIECFAASAGGKSVRGRSIVGAVCDESAFFRDASAVVNDVQIFQAITPRLLSGGSIVLPSTPWTRSGLLWSLYEANHGSPKTALVASAPTSLMRSDDPELIARIAAARERDPVNAAREFDAEWLPVGAGNLLDAAKLQAAVVDDVARARGPIVIALDPGQLQDPTAIVVAQKDGERIRVLECVELRPTPGKPIELSRIVAELDVLTRQYGVTSVVTDHHALQPLRETIVRAGARFALVPVGESNDERERRFIAVAEAVKSGTLEIPRRFGHLIEQLSSIVAEPRNGGGYRFTAPRRAGSHADSAMALVVAVGQLTRDNLRFYRQMASNHARVLDRAALLCGGVAGAGPESVYELRRALYTRAWCRCGYRYGSSMCRCR